jgi:hypothetical protein
MEAAVADLALEDADVVQSTGRWPQPLRLRFCKPLPDTTGMVSKILRFSAIFRNRRRRFAKSQQTARIPMAIGRNRLFPKGNGSPVAPEVAGSSPVILAKHLEDEFSDDFKELARL